MRHERDDVELVLAGAAICLGVVVLGTAKVAARTACIGVCSPASGSLRALASVMSGARADTAWGAPGMRVAVFWLTWALLLAAAAALALAGIGWISRVRYAQRTDPHRMEGLATVAQVRKAFSAKAMERMHWLRPDLEHPRADDLSIVVGRHRGQEVRIPVEDSLDVSAPSRSGKTKFFVDPILASFPGAVVSTSLRMETAAATVTHRRRRGELVALFAPGAHGPLAQGEPALRGATIVWPLTRGCQDASVALRRARALAANGAASGTGSDGFWESHARLVLAPLLHAAALSHGGVDALERWCQSPGTAREAVRVLQDHEDAAKGWASKLESELSGDERTVANIWKTVAGCVVEPLMDPAIKEAVSPGPGQELDLEAFIRGKGTLYIVDAAAAAAPFVAALIEDIWSTVVGIANRSRGNRLCPPILFCLDEISNIARLPSLPTMVSAGGGLNAMVLVVEQSRAQAAARWSPAEAEAIWDAATTKLVLGGIMREATLREVSSAAGQRTARRRTTNTSGGMTSGKTSWSETREAVLEASRVRTLPKGTGLLIKASAPIVAVDGHPL